MADSPWSLTARWVFPVASPPLPGGVVRIHGEHVVAVEPASCADIDLGNAAVLPGLVNAHTHLDLSGMRGLAPPTADFTAWLRQVIAHRLKRSPAQVQADIGAGLAESVRTGTTLIGDISGDGGSWGALAGSGIRAVVFRELLGLPDDRAAAAWETFIRWRTTLTDSLTCRPGVSPHAPYSARASLYQAASSAGLPVATHLAETGDELELLQRHAGPFVAFLQGLGVWAPDGLAGSPADVLDRCRSAPRLLLAHGNYLDPALVPPTAAVVYCPRTHAAFGHATHPYRRLLGRGVRVALGTDSLASNPDLDLLAEARFLRRLDPDLPGATLLHLATLAGAEALGWADTTGSLEAGKSADLVVVPLPDRPTNDPHDLVLGTDLAITHVLCRGRWLLGPAQRPAPTAP